MALDSDFFLLLGGCIGASCLVLWYWNTLRILRIATARRGKSALFMAILLPLAWALLAILLIAVFPFLLYTMLMLLSAW